MSSAEVLFFANPFWVWIALGGALLVGELMSGSGWLLWPAGAAAVAAVASHFIGWPEQILAFVVVAVVATYVGRRYLRGAPKGETDINDPAHRVVGHVGEAATPFTAGLGRVFVDGKEWSAELDGGGDLAAKAKVEVTAILGGARLKVKAA
ncbi:MAG TPA: NfeD family protein [Caulobacteraceae bacterium]|jgi:hypothetical protein